MSQRSTAALLYHLTMRRSRTLIKRLYGTDWWNSFKNQSNQRFRELISEFPNIGDSMFAFNCFFSQVFNPLQYALFPDQ